MGRQAKRNRRECLPHTNSALVFQGRTKSRSRPRKACSAEPILRRSSPTEDVENEKSRSGSVVRRILTRSAGACPAAVDERPIIPANCIATQQHRNRGHGYRQGSVAVR